MPAAAGASLARLKARSWQTLRGLLGLVPGFNALSRWRILHKYKQAELDYCAGRLRPSTDHPTVLYFGTSRSGAKPAAKVFLPQLLAPAGLRALDLEGLRFNGGAMNLEQREAEGRLGEVFQPRGFFFGPLRRLYRGIPELERYRVILQLRDPRDVLVSSYFSLVYSHTIPFQNPPAARSYEAYRLYMRSMSIDRSVLERAPAFRRIYADYLDQLLGRPNVLLLRYEQMVTDFPSWLEKVEGFLELDLPAAERAAFVRSSQAYLRVDGVDPYRDRRQMTPGDHRRQLQPETVARLNELLGDVLGGLGYLRG